jgi:uncharacterized protein involved in exopolysaccharide biosynthesis
VAVEAPADAQPTLTPQRTLAKVVRERAELSSVYGAGHPAMIEAAAAEATLRQHLLEADPERFHRDLIRALSEELADARRDQRLLGEGYGEEHPQMRRAQTAVRGLTAAINAEVHAAG